MQRSSFSELKATTAIQYRITTVSTAAPRSPNISSSEFYHQSFLHCSCAAVNFPFCCCAVKQREVKIVHGQWSEDGQSLAVYNQASRSVLLFETGLVSYEWRCSSWGFVVGLVAVPESKVNASSASAEPKFLAICERGQVLCLSKAHKPLLVSRLFSLIPKPNASLNWLWKWGTDQSVKAVAIHSGKNPVLAVVSEGQAPEPTTSQNPSPRIHSLGTCLFLASL